MERRSSSEQVVVMVGITINRMVVILEERGRNRRGLRRVRQKSGPRYEVRVRVWGHGDHVLRARRDGGAQTGGRGHARALRPRQQSLYTEGLLGGGVQRGGGSHVAR